VTDSRPPTLTPAEETERGRRYFDGSGGEQDYAKAMEWYRKAADDGYAPAQDVLGQMYENGLGARKDYDKAFDWYSKAAPFFSNAQYDLGKLFENGLGVTPDYTKAREWYRKAADQGNQDASIAFHQLGGN
jgi:TPR repeat protein